MKILFLIGAVASAVAALKPHEHDAIREQYIKKLNGQPGMTWTAGINPRFKGTPLHSSKDLCGVKNHSIAELDKYAKRVNTRLLGATALPDSFDSEANWPECAKVIGTSLSFFISSVC